MATFLPTHTPALSNLGALRVCRGLKIFSFFVPAARGARLECACRAKLAGRHAPTRPSGLFSELLSFPQNTNGRLSQGKNTIAGEWEQGGFFREVVLIPPRMRSGRQKLSMPNMPGPRRLHPNGDGILSRHAGGLRGKSREFCGPGFFWENVYFEIRIFPKPNRPKPWAGFYICAFGQ